MKKLIYTLVILLTGYSAISQANFSLYQLNNTAQSQYLNPAFRSSAKVGVSIAPFSSFLNLQFLNSGFALDDALATRPNSDSLDLTPENLVDNLNDVNYLDFNLRTELAAFILTTKKSTFSFTAGAIVNAGVSYPKDLLRLAFYGNGGPEFLGQRAAIDNLGVDALGYLEFGAGYNRKIGDKLVVGGKLKYLVGLANIQTERMQAGITTDATTYELALDGAARINTSNTAFFDDLSDPMALLNNLKVTNNHGIGLDLGATYALNDRINLSASIIDLGAITWRDDVTNYEIEEFSFNYKGIDVIEFLNDSTAVFDAISDSLETASDIKETNNKYSTNLFTKAYLGGNFEITDFFNVGLVWFSSFNPSRYMTAVNVSANVKLSHWLSATANYGLYSYRDSNIGLGASVRTGPIQFFVMTDNVFAAINPQSAKNWHVNFGMSIQVGKSQEYKK